MAKKSARASKRSSISLPKSNPLSQVLIGITVLAILAAAVEYVTQNDFTRLAPTQLFLLAGVLGVLGLYMKDEK